MGVVVRLGVIRLVVRQKTVEVAEEFDDAACQECDESAALARSGGILLSLLLPPLMRSKCLVLWHTPVRTPCTDVPIPVADNGL